MKTLFKPFLILLFLFKGSEKVYSQTKKPTVNYHYYNFKSAVPEDEGFSSEKLSLIFPYVKKYTANVHSLMIIRHDKIILNAYFYPYYKGLQHDIASCTKSIISILIGIAIDKGFINDENELVKSYFPEIKSYSRNFETLTIKDLLTMTSGLNCDFGNDI